jgi:hypothetical protein
MNIRSIICTGTLCCLLTSLSAHAIGTDLPGCFAGSNDSLPLVLPKNHSDLTESRLRNEAFIRFGVNQLPVSLKDWETYRIKLKNEIIRKLGVVFNHSLPVSIKETVTLQRQGYSIKNIAFQVRPGIYATANLYIPDGHGPFPGVIVMCGHSTNGRLYDNYQSVGHTLALNGYVALAIDPWGAGERTTIHGKFEYHGANLGASLMNIGETLLGMQISDNVRGVDLLCSLPYVDKNNIGATGASGGGNQTMWVASMDERIKAAVPVVSVGSFESYVMRSNCICETFVDGLTITEEAGVLALARGIMPCNHLKDSNPAFFPSEMLRSYNNARPVFQLQGAEDNLSYRIFDLPHGYHPEDRQAMLGWFDRKLKGIGTGAPKQEKPFDLVPAEKLMTFAIGTRDANVISTEEYCKRKGAELRTLFLNNRTFIVEKKKKELMDVLRINERSELKGTNWFSKVNGWNRIALETTDGKLIPLLILPPANNSLGYVILSDPSGKNNISLSSVDEIRRNGAGIAIVDLTGTGEVASLKDNPTDKTMKLHNVARAELWLGKSVIGEWVKELNVVTGYLVKDMKATKVAVEGTKETGLAGLFLGATLGKVDEIILHDAPVSYLFDNREFIDFFSLGVHLPGFLNWGDVSLAAALSGKNVVFINPVTMSGQKIIGSRLKDCQAEFDRIREICKQPGKTSFKEAPVQ